VRRISSEHEAQHLKSAEIREQNCTKGDGNYISSRSIIEYKPEELDQKDTLNHNLCVANTIHFHVVVSPSPLAAALSQQHDAAKRTAANS